MPRELSIEFWFENMGTCIFSIYRARKILHVLKAAGFALDTGHAHINHCLAGFLQTGFSHMYIHDNDGRKDTHSSVGEGDIDFIPVMAALRCNHASAVIEVKSFDGVKKSIHALEMM